MVFLAVASAGSGSVGQPSQSPRHLSFSSSSPNVFCGGGGGGGCAPVAVPAHAVPERTVCCLL